MNTVNPKIVYNPKPVNLDLAIQELQLFLAPITWLNKIFGKAQKGFQKDVTGRRSAFPETFYGGAEYYNLLPSDALVSYCFFAPVGKARPVEYEPNIWNQYQQTINIICWMNLRAIDNDLTKFPNTENLLADMRARLRFFSAFTITGIYTQADEVFSDYDLNLVDTQYLKYPFGGFKIQGDLNYLEAELEECQIMQPEYAILLQENLDPVLQENQEAILIS